ncbi:MAG: ATP12 family protein [Pseudomonadota bacterium]
MSEWKQKRFWKDASVEQLASGFSILLDGRAVKTPAKAALVVPTALMAEALAGEWQAQEDVVNPLTMPFTRSANAAIDKVIPQQIEVTEMIAAYGDSDLLCYRAGQPDSLIARQKEIWDPYLDWAAEIYDARLFERAGLMHEPQPKAALERLKAPLDQMSAFEMAAMHDLVSLTGSLVLGLAAARDFQNPKDIWSASRLDEIWQAEQWGQDEEAEQTASHREAAFLHAKAFFDSAQLN